MLRSRHAYRIVKGFRRGLYHQHVDFHVDEVSNFLEQAQTRAESQSYNHIILDLPSPQDNFALASKVLRVGGSLLVWVPSITQVIDAVKLVKQQNLPLWLDQVVEMGQGYTSGRRWDVRLARIRSVDRERERAKDPLTEVLEARDSHDANIDLESESDRSASSARYDALDFLKDTVPRYSEDSVKEEEDKGWTMVCRPKVGEIIVGGGFLGVWKRTAIGSW